MRPADELTDIYTHKCLSVPEGIRRGNKVSQRIRVVLACDRSAAGAPCLGTVGDPRKFERPVALASRGPVVRCCQKCRRFGKSSSRGQLLGGGLGVRKPGLRANLVGVGSRRRTVLCPRGKRVGIHRLCLREPHARLRCRLPRERQTGRILFLVRLTGLVLDLLAHELGESR